eukprot:5319259-Amphidinium_carterae.1
MVRHAKIVARGRRDLSDAIADNVLLVEVRQRVLGMTAGDIYRKNLPKAIVDVAMENGVDHGQWSVHFRLCVRGALVQTPETTWDVALSLGADL